jgi:hypothetical protein
MTAIILQQTTGIHHISLQALHTLEEVGFQDGCLPMRALDTKHVQILVAIKLANTPPIEVVETVNGYGIIDGYHRVEAARRLGHTDIRAHVQFYVNENDVIDAAFIANIAHGKPASAKERKNYVLWLYITTKLNQTEIAEKAGIQQSWVSRIISEARREKSVKNDDVWKLFTRICKRFIASYKDFNSITAELPIDKAAYYLLDELRKQKVQNSLLQDMIKVMKEVEKQL